jgi:hypothetical protein
LTVPRAANRRDFYRTHVSLTEKAIGGSLLIALAAIAVGILLKGALYDPSRYTGSVEALEFTRQAVAGKAGTLRGGGLRAHEAAGGAAAAGSAGAAIPALIATLEPMGPVEHYSAETLFEKINGRAPVYFEYNFVALASRSFAVAGQPGEFVDAYLFEMDSPLNAFGIFSAERESGGAALEFAADGYRSEMGYFMRVGSTYAQVIASSPAPAVMDTAGAFTRALAGTIAADDSGLEGRLLLPAEDQLPGSLTYINENAYGQAVLNGVFEARYRVDGAELTLFAQVAPSPEAARANWDTLRAFHASYGALEPVFEEAGAEFFVADLFGQWTAVFTRGDAVVGVVNADDREAALALLRAQLAPAQDAAADPYDPYAEF